jgi:hypothetical protein
LVEGLISLFSSAPSAHDVSAHNIVEKAVEKAAEKAVETRGAQISAA